jgi:hypothetical protein
MNTVDIHYDARRLALRASDRFINDRHNGFFPADWYLPHELVDAYESMRESLPPKESFSLHVALAKSGSAALAARVIPLLGGGNFMSLMIVAHAVSTNRDPEAHVAVAEAIVSNAQPAFVDTLRDYASKFDPHDYVTRHANERDEVMVAFAYMSMHWLPAIGLSDDVSDFSDSDAEVTLKKEEVNTKTFTSLDEDEKVPSPLPSPWVRIRRILCCCSGSDGF